MHVRPATSRDAAALADAYIDSFKSAYAGIIDKDDLNDISVRDVESRVRRWFASGAVVLSGIHKRDGIVGLIAAGPSDGAQPDFPAEIYAHYVMEEYQRRGLGRRLFTAAAQELKARQFNALIAWVPAKNAAKGFYEALGGDRISTRPMVIEGKHLEGIGFGWRDLTALSARDQ